MGIATDNQITENYLPQDGRSKSIPESPLADIVSKDQFLKLLITQLQHQDPLNPMESTEFTSQLAQFTSLEQLFNLNAGFEGLKSALTSLNDYQASNLIGKNVKTAGNTLRVADSQVMNQGAYALEGPANMVSVNIYDKDGFLVRTLNEPATEAGLNSVNWDGTGLHGQSVPDGDYYFEVTAVDGVGGRIEAASYIEGEITGLTFGPGGSTSLLMHGLVVDLADVLEIAKKDVTTNS